MDRVLTLGFQQGQSRGDVVNHLDLRLQPAPRGWPTRLDMTFRHEGRTSLPEPASLDGYVFGILLLAMSHADRLVVKGPVTAKALRNAQAWGEAWHCWLPDEYRPVEIVPESVLDDASLQARPRPQAGRAIAAFSGGADAVFLALRHAGRALGDASWPVSDVVMVRGYDTSADDVAGFDTRLRRSRPLLDRLGLDAHVVASDMKTRSAQDWHHSHGAQLACVLHQFAGEFDYGLIAGSDSYDRPPIAWGSTPATDYLMSGGEFEIVHEGGAFTRTQKIELIARDPLARRGLHVCWEGPGGGLNCGSCEKCVRTRLNFLAVGLSDPECFDEPFDPAMIDSLQVSTKGQLIELETILEYAHRGGLDQPWVDRLGAQVELLVGLGPGQAAEAEPGPPSRLSAAARRVVARHPAVRRLVAPVRHAAARLHAPR